MKSKKPIQKIPHGQIFLPKDYMKIEFSKPKKANEPWLQTDDIQFENEKLLRLSLTYFFVN